MRATQKTSLQFLIHVVLLCFAAATVLGADNPPAASNIIHRLLERSDKVAKSDASKHYTYEKRSVAEELNDAGKVIKSTEKLYKVKLVNGLPFPRLVKIQGRELTAAELEKQNKREEEFRKKVTQVDVKQKAAKKEGLATKDLVDKFEFKLVKRELINGRPTFVVTFKPKAAAGSGTGIEDRVLSCLTGTIWVDEEDYELAKLETKLRESMSLGWFGMFGALTRLDITMARARMPDGVWVNTRNSFAVVGRKLFETMRYRTIEESSGFKRE